jgi:beta-phosphoglucomutase-like phosphatase (HAD superfamily)
MFGKLGIIFDFDGVIVLSEPVHQRAWSDVAAEVGRDLPDGFLDCGIGRSDGALADELAAFWADGVAGERILSLKRQCYQRRCAAETPFVPGAPEAVRFFTRQYPLALATSSSIEDIRPHLEQHDLGRHFRAVLTIESIRRPKPDPEIYLRASEQLGVEPSRCWVFEDSPHGVQAARAAGMRVIGLTTTLAPAQLSMANSWIGDFKDLDAIADRLMKD